MKAILKNMLLAYTGKCDGLVFYYNKRLDRVLARSLPQWKPNANNDGLSRVAHQLKALEVSEGYRRDLKTYTELYRARYGDSNCVGWYNLFNKLMWALSKDCNIDLAGITREQIYSGDLHCVSVKRSVEAGLLPEVDGYERLDCSL